MAHLTFGGKGDARLEWAILDGFSAVVDPKDDSQRIGLLILWNSPDDAQGAMRLAMSLKIHVPRTYADISKDGAWKVRLVWGLTGPATALIHFVQRALPFIKRVELAAAVRPSPQLAARIDVVDVAGKVLVGVLDDGFAFANTRFTRAGKLRCLWFWNQDPASKGIPLDGTSGPSSNVTYGYGGQWSNIGLASELTSSNGIADGAYREIGVPSLRRSVAHGTHVADLVAGDDPTAPGVKSGWDLVVVQFPQSGVDDPSGSWLGLSVLDGLHYVLEAASAATTQVIVNCSWGPQHGPHDGSSVLEVEFEQVVKEQRELHGRQVVISLPAGNSFNSQAHASMPCAAGGSVEWMVPPDGTTPAYVEVWWPPSVTLKHAVLTIETPDGGVYKFKQTYGFKKQYDRFDIVKEVFGTSGVVIGLTVHPTALKNRKKRGQHGRWTLTVDAIATTETAPIHIYVARADHNMGAKRRAKASYLTDRAYEAARFGPAPRRDDEVLASAVRRQGTLNGIATGLAPWVAGGFSFADLRSASYTSSGPSRGSRTQPDFSCITDRSITRRGVRGSGNRSGTRFTLIGTSTAAPQLASKVVLWQFTSYDDPVTYDPKRDGTALMEADPLLIGRS